MSISDVESVGDRGEPRGFDRRHRVGPVQAVSSNATSAAERICQLAVADQIAGTHIHLINAYTVALADRDPAYARALSEGAVNLPDGKPLTWVSRLRRDETPLSQVRGHQLFLNVIDMGRSVNLKHFLLGSTEEVLAKMTENLTRRFPGVEIVGTYSPPFRRLDENELSRQDATIRLSGAQVVWVGLGTPKQDFESERLAQCLPVVAIAVGAAFDFTAGTFKEAPLLVQRVGMEWAYRFAKEPRRLWRRYVFGNTRFIKSAMRHGRHGKPDSRTFEL